MIALCMQGGRPKVLLQECRNGVSLGITDGKILISRWGRARDTRPPCTCTSILPIFFVVLLLCFTECFTCRLPDGGSQLPVGEPAGYPMGVPGYQYGRDKKKPRQQGILSGRLAGGKRGVLYRFTPAGLQSHCTVQIRIRQDLRKIYFFYLIF